MKQILLAIDGSSDSLEGAREVAHMFHAHHLSITVLMVMEPDFYSDGQASKSEWLVEQEASEQRRADNAFEQVHALLGSSNAIVNCERRKGEIGVTILAIANEIDADLIVLGARGRSLVRRMLLGSTSDYVATHAPASVLVVRPSDGGHRDRPMRIGIALDPLNRRAEPEVELAGYPWQGDPHVEVVAVTEYIEGFSRRQTPQEVTIAENHRCVQRRVERLRKSIANVTPRFIDGEHVGESLIRYVSDQQLDMMVVAETNRAAFGRFLLGSVSRYVLRHAPTSIWISR